MPTKKHTLQIGLIGTGMIGRIQLPHWQKHPHCKVKAVADVNIESAHAAASEFSVPDVYADYHELLDDDAIDAVVVCTPPFLHKEMSIDALRAGKHVLCEKPFATDVESANTMVAVAKETGYTLACCSARFRFTPVLKRAAAMIANGEFGDIYFIRTVGIGRRGRPGLEYHPAARWFLDKNKAGGGALMDWGCYDLDMLWGLLGGLRVESVTGFAFQGVDEPDTGGYTFNVEEHGGAYIRCMGGLTIAWERASASHGHEDARTQVYGSRGGLQFRYVSWGTPFPTEYYHDDENGRPTTETLPETAAGPDIHRDVLYDFVDAVLEGREPATTGKMAAEMVRITMAVYKSAAIRQTVQL